MTPGVLDLYIGSELDYLLYIILFLKLPTIIYMLL